MTCKDKYFPTTSRCQLCSSRCFKHPLPIPLISLSMFLVSGYSLHVDSRWSSSEELAVSLGCSEMAGLWRSLIHDCSGDCAYVSSSLLYSVVRGLVRRLWNGFLSVCIWDHPSKGIRCAAYDVSFAENVFGGFSVHALRSSTLHRRLFDIPAGPTPFSIYQRPS